MTTLKDKYFGCIAASWIGSSMGAAVEGWDYERIEEKYGRLDRLLPILPVPAGPVGVNRPVPGVID